jgi:hypothetical protein
LAPDAGHVRIVASRIEHEPRYCVCLGLLLLVCHELAPNRIAVEEHMGQLVDQYLKVVQRSSAWHKVDPLRFVQGYPAIRNTVGQLSPGNGDLKALFVRQPYQCSQEGVVQRTRRVSSHERDVAIAVA